MPRVNPLTPHGNNHKKNLRHRRSRKRKERKERRAHPRIAYKPTVRRTLRKAPREALHRNTDAKYIHPWIRNNAAFRLQGCIHPTACLPGLPKEVRQKVLHACYPLGDEGADGRYFAQGKRSARWRVLCARVAELCCVSPVLRVDMEYVGARWKDELLEEEKARRGDTQGPRVLLNGPGKTGYVSKRKAAKACVVEVRRGKKDYKRNRPPKCWYCEKRHPNGDPICPLERKNEAKWLENTKVLKKRSRVIWEEKGYDKRRILFDD